MESVNQLITWGEISTYGVYKSGYNLGRYIYVYGVCKSAYNLGDISMVNEVYKPAYNLGWYTYGYWSL